MYWEDDFSQRRRGRKERPRYGYVLVKRYTSLEAISQIPGGKIGLAMTELSERIGDPVDLPQSTSFPIPANRLFPEGLSRDGLRG